MLSRKNTTLAVAIMTLTAACGGHYKLGSDNADAGDAGTNSAPDTQQQSNPTPTAGTCIKSTDCPQDPCEPQTCINAKCEKNPIPCGTGFVCKVGACVAVEQQCSSVDDGDLCTSDSCNGLTGKAVHMQISCEDNNPITVDSCSNGICQHTPGCPASCFDNDLCTIDTCNAGVCSHQPTPCASGTKCVNGDCKPDCNLNVSVCDDKNPCTIDACGANGTCVNTPQNCDDGDAFTIDSCEPKAAQNGMPFTCKHDKTICAACDDKNPCTVDSCQNNQCLFQPLPCGQGTKCVAGACILDAACKVDADCDDGIACNGKEKCLANFVCVKGTSTCQNGLEACDALTGLCVKLDKCPASCDDGDLLTIDFCQNGACVHQPFACADGKAMNPATGKCETAPAAPDCVNGTIKCMDVEQTKTLNYVECVNGHWFTIEICGPIALPATQCLNDAGGCVKGGNKPDGNPPQQCTPQCTNKNCGDNGCGGTCGTCAAGSTCSANGQCVANQPLPGCFPFDVLLPANTAVTDVLFWNGDLDPTKALIVVVHLSPAEQATGLKLSSPASACAATTEYSGRWASWQNGTFPAGAPTGTCDLKGFNKSVGFCQLKKGEGAWGCATDGICK